MVGPRGDETTQGHIGLAVVERRVRQPERDQVVDRIEIERAARMKRQGGGPVDGVGGAPFGLEPHRGGRAIEAKTAIGPLEQVAA
jgi:hypothetical protein